MNDFETKVAKRVLALIESTGYPINICNGQRHYGPPPDWPPHRPPPNNSEIFVGRLPRDCFEDELVPLFSTVGTIYRLRLMMDFSGSNRGFAYVEYTKPSEALKAIELLDKYEMRPNHRIGVVESVDNRRLFIGNLPPNLSRNQVFEVMSYATDKVVSAVLHYNSNKVLSSDFESRGFAFVEYETHR